MLEQSERWGMQGICAGLGTTGMNSERIGGETLFSFFGVGTAEAPIRMILKDIQKRPALVKRIRDLRFVILEE